MAEPMAKQPEIKKPAGEKKWLLWGLIGFTVILLVTAVVLFFQLRKPVEQPLPKPAASPTTPPVKQAEPENVCQVTFSLSPSPSPSPTPSPSVSPSPSPEPECFDECDNDNDCPDDLYCMDVSGVNRCVNSECPEETDCDCDEDCFDECDNDNDCPDDLRCLTYPGTSDLRCLNADCREESDCSCDEEGASPTPSPGVYASPGASPIARVEQPDLPEAGVSAPAVLGVSVGLLMLILGLLF